MKRLTIVTFLVAVLFASYAVVVAQDAVSLGEQFEQLRVQASPLPDANSIMGIGTYAEDKAALVALLFLPDGEQQLQVLLLTENVMVVIYHQRGVYAMSLYGVEKFSIGLDGHLWMEGVLVMAGEITAREAAEMGGLWLDVIRDNPMPPDEYMDAGAEGYKKLLQMEA